MRLYSFTNYYLSSLQHGLQTAHVVGELLSPTVIRTSVIEWAKEHKTIIIKNGGNQKALQDIVTMFSDEANPYPWAVFREDQASLAGAFTAVGVVVPEKFYVDLDKRSCLQYSEFDMKLLSLIQRTPLAI